MAVEERDFLEEEILSALLANKESLAKALEEKVTPSCFADPANQLVARALWQIFGSQAAYPPQKDELAQILTRFSQSSDLKENDWAAVLDKIARRRPPLGPQLVIAFDLLKARRHLGLIRQVGEQISRFLADFEKKEKIDAGRFSRSLISQLEEIAAPAAQLSSLEEELAKFYRLADKGLAGGKTLRLDPPFSVLDGRLGGIKPGDCYLLLSAPQRGKTTLALNWAQALAANEKIPVLYVSWSQPAADLVISLLTSESRLDRQNLTAGPISPDSAAGKKLLQAEEKLGPWAEHLHFIEADSTTDLREIELALRFLKEKFSARTAALFLDSLPDIPAPVKQNKETRLLVTAHLSQELARKWNLPVILLSSLNRQGCQADQKDSPAPPTIYDLAGPVEIIYGCAECLLLRKNWALTRILRDKLGQHSGLSRPGPAKVEVLELVLEKNRSGWAGQCLIQYLYLPDKNIFLEVAEAAEAKKSETETHLAAQTTVLMKKLSEEESLLG